MLAKDNKAMAPSESKPISSCSGRVASYAYGALTVLVALACLNGMYRAISGGTTDFNGFWDAGHAIWQDGAFATGKAVERYPPTFQLCMVPFGALPYPCAVIVWSILNASALITLPRLFRRLWGFSLRHQLPGWLIISPFALDNLVLCQSGPLLLWLVTASLLCIQRKAYFASGGLLGLGIGLKVLPIVFVALCLLQVRSRVCCFAFGLVTALALPVALGFCLLSQPTEAIWENASGWYDYVRTDGSAAGMLANGRSLRYNNQAPAIVMGRTFGNIPPGSAKGAIRIASFDLISVMWWHRALIALILLVWFAAVWLAYRSAREAIYFRLFGMTAIAMLAGSPIVWTHYFIWLGPASVEVSRGKGLRKAVALLVAVCTGLALRPARAIGFHMAIALAFFGFIAYRCFAASTLRRPASGE